jgi:hypothetical protein
MQPDRIPQFSTHGLLKLHSAIREALEADDSTPAGQPPVYGVRDLPDWHVWSNALEAELDGRGARYAKIRWSPRPDPRGLKEREPPPG